jgi:hypothetical protein
VAYQDEQRATLERAFEEFKNVPFPVGSRDEEADELHADLALYDTYVAGFATSLLAGGTPTPVEFDVELETRLRRLAGEDRLAASDAKRYLDYLAEIRKLLELARPLA